MIEWMSAFIKESGGGDFLMPKDNSEQKEKPLAGISLKMACGSKMALFLFAVTLIFLKLPL